MADTVLFNIAEGILVKVADPLLQKIGFCGSLHNELERLKDTVSTIQAVLLDAEERQSTEHQVKDWLAKLKEVVYDAEDLFDGLSVEALQREASSENRVFKKVRRFFSFSNPISYGFKVGHEIKAIRERLDEIASNKEKFHFEERRYMEETPSRDQSHSIIIEERVTGRENEKLKILQLLDANTVHDISFVSIVGIGGVGKTTLAQLVYNDHTINKSFELKLWVCVSDVFDIKVILEKALKSVTNKKPEDLELDQLQKLLRKELDRKKYLIVLDDVWNEDPLKWLALKELLMCGARGSRILVTTRSKMVAESTGTSARFNLEGLSPLQSWSLFIQVVFKGEEPRCQYVKEIGKKILEKCAGVPLAIKTVGRMLYFRSPESEWFPFLENELSRIPQTGDDILPTLKLSYNHLPSHLKRCFAFCSLFPKDYEIDVETLIQLWIAQGFVRPSSPQHHLEAIGLQYFKDLLWRSFLHGVEEDRWGNLKSCKMHDLMHDLATLVAEVEIIQSNMNGDYIQEKTRHLSFDFDLDTSNKIPGSLFDARRLRTLLLPNQGYKEACSGSNYEVMFTNFRFLRVFDLHNTGIVAELSSVNHLKHLKYLDLSNNVGIQVLPQPITDLVNLQVLKLSFCRGLKELPKYIEKLLNLRHLYCDGCDKLTHMPSGIGKLTFLQSLSKFVVAMDSSVSENVLISHLVGLNKLNNLRGCLEISNLGYVRGGVLEFKAANLKEKRCLQSLILSWNQDDYKDACYEELSLQSLEPHPSLKELKVYEYGGIRFPNWLSSLTNLVDLCIEDCNRCQFLQRLDRIPSLKCLEIRRCEALEYMVNDGNAYDCLNKNGGRSTFFPSLKELYLEYCPNLKGWWKKTDEEDTTKARASTTARLPHFPCLSTLRINRCPELTWMPLFPSLDDRLSLENATIKPFQLTMEMKVMAPPIASSLVFPLSKLKELEFRRIGDLESLPEVWMQNLTSLQKLYIGCCPRLTSLPQGMHHLTSLRELAINFCPEVKEKCGNKNGVDWSSIAHVPYIIIDRQVVQIESQYL